MTTMKPKLYHEAILAAVPATTKHDPYYNKETEDMPRGHHQSCMEHTNVSQFFVYKCVEEYHLSLAEQFPATPSRP